MHFYLIKIEIKVILVTDLRVKLKEIRRLKLKVQVPRSTLKAKPYVSMSRRTCLGQSSK